MNNRKWLLFVLTVHTTVRAGRQEKERPLQSQMSTAGVAVGLVNSTSLLFVYSSLHYIKYTHTQTQTGKLDWSGSINSALRFSSFFSYMFFETVIVFSFVGAHSKCFFAGLHIMCVHYAAGGNQHYAFENTLLRIVSSVFKTKQSCNEYDLANLGH